jgi:hypothetical protein
VDQQPLAQLLEDLLHEASDNGLEVTLSAAYSVPPTERLAVEGEYVQRYARAVHAVNHVRGPASFSGTPRDMNYPPWHRAQRLTTWTDVNGIVYVGLAELDGYPCIVAGARPHPFERETITLLPPAS